MRSAFAGKLAVLILLVASAGLVLAGLMVQITLEEEELLGSDTANSIKEVIVSAIKQRARLKTYLLGIQRLMSQRVVKPE